VSKLRSVFLRNRGSIPGMGESCFSMQKGPYHPLNPAASHLNGTRCSVLRDKEEGEWCWLIHIHLALKIRMSGTILLLTAQAFMACNGTTLFYFILRKTCLKGLQVRPRNITNWFISFSNFNAQFLYSLTICMLRYNPQHVYSINMHVFRRTNCIIIASGIVTLCSHPAYCTAVYREWRCQMLW
jgi:hypothetical protein